MMADANKVMWTKDQIERKMRQMRERDRTLYNLKTISPDSTNGKIYFYLMKAYLAVDGYKIYNEIDVGQ